MAKRASVTVELLDYLGLQIAHKEVTLPLRPVIIWGDMVFEATTAPKIYIQVRYHIIDDTRAAELGD